jgi:pseudomonalisin
VRWLVTIATVAVSASVAFVHVQAAQTYEMRSALSPRTRLAHLLRSADPGESLAMSLTLQVRHHKELDGLITAEQQPGSPDYHRWLSPEQFTERFAPSSASYAALVDWLEKQGFTVRRWPNRLRIDFAGSVAQVTDAFRVRMNRYRQRGRDVLANENAPSLPLEFHDTIAFVRLNTFPLADRLVRVVTSGTQVDTMAPRDMYTAYDMEPLLGRGIDGSMQTLAVVARADFDVGSVTTFQNQFGVPVRTPLRVFPGRNPGIGSVNGVCLGIRDPYQRQQCIVGEEDEVLLDVEWASAMAPGASVLVDISDTDIDASLLDVVTHHPEAKTIALSFGSCERLDNSSLQLFEPMYAQAAAQGQTVLVAAGDSGADGCQDGRSASVNVLGSDPNVTSVGGTALDPGFDAAGNATAYVSERVWQDRDGAGGGGPSTLVAKPAYQAAPGVPIDGFRSQPDVSLMTSPSQAGYVAIFQRQVAVVGGTSAAAPSWAGIVAMLNQAVQADGLGALNHTLYALGRSQYAEHGVPVFHDVTAGDNSSDGVAGFSAGPGYDLATGLGTPDVDVLARAVVAAVCVGDCNGDASVTVDELLTGARIALGQASLSECPSLDTHRDGRIAVDQLLQAANHALDGCQPR